MNKYWYLYGASGLGIETLDILKDSLEGATPAFLDDNKLLDLVNGIKVICPTPELVGDVTISIGEPSIRAMLFKKVLDSNLNPRKLISKHSFVSEYSEIGDGSIIAPMCSIQATAKIGKNVAVNTMSIVGHDVVVHNSAVISSQVNLGGGTEIGEQSYIGMGALIREGVKIGKNCIIGMGSVVHKDISDGMIAMGNPARPLKKNLDNRVFG